MHINTSKTSIFSLVTLLLGLSLSVIGCAPRGVPVEDPSDRFHLGEHHFEITTDKPEAQLAFDRGLTLAYAFSHAEAEREFRRTAELDPECAMAWWGVALVNGPHINFPLVPEKNAAIAWEALTRAKRTVDKTSALEQALISALEKRYLEKQPADRAPLDLAYAEAMRAVQKQFPENADVTTLLAEALMDLHPWDLWLPGGQPQVWTPEIVVTLERALALNPNHPGANHLYVHTMEASSHPERAIPAADTLRELVPGAGHLVHMPAHIYIRTDRWNDAALANLRAIEADREYRKKNPRPGFYGVYVTHNHHFLTFVYMMQGRKAAALDAARTLVASIPEDFLADFGPFADGFLVTPVEVLLRFGDWEGVLAEPLPNGDFPLSKAFVHFARATALTSLGRRGEALAERSKFLRFKGKVPATSTFGNNASSALLEIAHLVLDGEMAAREGRYDEAIERLTTAATLEDKLRYDEPPDWIQPVRHALGAVLLKAGNAAEAEKVYREDLNRFPGNGWSLVGLSEALNAQGRAEEASKVKKQFETEWKQADVNIGASCACLKKDEQRKP